MALHRSHGSSSVLESSEGGFLSHVQPDEFTVSSPNIAELQIYYYANAQTTHTTYPDGLEVVQFLNKQTDLCKEDAECGCRKDADPEAKAGRSWKLRAGGSLAVSGWSTVAPSLLTAASISRVQAILLPQPPK
ncbi:putative T-complex protein 10A homolog isoform X2 [Hylobates moloch]|uniref:putative T-complex protein 10A homolog isoform X2 n=1 Tax=Hylobates moloch TaxID=81572 RepID=UPI002675F7F0|nr:putative T-complex protein 10A homolog isoform X2 [Hylobates moloch]